MKRVQRVYFTGGIGSSGDKNGLCKTLMVQGNEVGCGSRVTTSIVVKDSHESHTNVYLDL